jgi:hypothetical protein
MREIKWSSETVSEFVFGNKESREALILQDNFTYGHFCIGSGFATICGGRIGNNLYYGVSFCSPEDNFSKKSGRDKAVEHLIEVKHGNLRGVLNLADIADEQPALILQEAVRNHLAKMRNRKPQWAKNSPIKFRGKTKKLKVVLERLISSHGKGTTDVNIVY